MTRMGFNLWRAEMKAQMGGTFDWAQVSEGQARDLAEHLFNGADVPEGVQAQYWDAFNGYLNGLREAAS